MTVAALKIFAIVLTLFLVGDVLPAMLIKRRSARPNDGRETARKDRDDAL